MPLLTLLTRCHPDRPKMLARCVASVEAQSDQDLQHLLLRPEIEPHDIIKVGPLIHYAASQITGDYVMQLPDDDRLASPNFVADLRAVVAGGAVEVVIHRMEYGDSWICPPEPQWSRRQAVVGYIAGQNMIARADIYRAASGEWLRPVYEADFYYIQKALSIAKAVVWWNYIGIESQGKIGNNQGRGEAQIALKPKAGG
jgi:hypothetical protein